MVETKANPDAPAFAPWAGSWRWTLLLVLGVTALRLIWLAFMSPYALAEDEAHYWEWSRRLDLSYYSKGPGIAWTIWLSTQALGDTVLGVRALGPVFGAITAISVAALSRAVFKDRRVAFFSATLVLLVPAYQLTSLLMTIDGPYLACWSLGALLAHRAMIGRSKRAWAGLGLVLGVGFLFKYTILLLPVGLVAFAIVHRKRLARPALSGVAIGVALFVLSVLPVVIWNAREGFPTIRHLLGHVGVAGGDIPLIEGCDRRGGFPGLTTLEFLGTQAAIIGPALGLAAMAIARTWRTRPARRSPGVLLLVWISLPILVFYLLVTLRTEGEANWPIAGYLTLLPLAARAAVRGMDRLVQVRGVWKREGRAGRPPRNIRHVLWHASLVMGLVAGFGLVLLDPISRLPGAAGEVARLDRVRRGPRLAQNVRDRLEELRAETGLEPFVIGSHYGRVSLLAFEMPRLGEDAELFCASAVLPSFPDEGMCPGRKTQYDLWSETDLRNPDVIERLRGRPAVLLGARRRQWQGGFAEVSQMQEDGREQDRVTFVGYGFRGFE